MKVISIRKLCFYNKSIKRAFRIASQQLQKNRTFGKEKEKAKQKKLTFEIAFWLCRCTRSTKPH
jgi:hypothetical protein